MSINNYRNERVHSIDFARVVLISLGIVIHSAQVFNPSAWLIQCKEPQIFFSYIINVLSSFRMHGFYLISGYFSMMMIYKYGEYKFAYKRIIQLGIPTLFCGLTLNTVSSIYSNRNTSNSVTLFDYNYIFDGTWMGHLWFLPNLIVYTILFCVARIVFVKFKCLSIPKLTFSAIFIFLIFSELALGATARFIYRYFSESTWIFFDIFKFTKYFPFYLIGIYLYKDNYLYEFIDKYRLNSMILFVSFTVIIINWLEILKLNSIILYIATFSLALSVNGIVLFLFSRLFNRDSKIIKSLSDSSYTIYVLHQPLIIIIGFYTTQLNINNFVNFIFLILTVFLFSYILHVKVIDKNELTSFLFNGKLKKTSNVAVST